MRLSPSIWLVRTYMAMSVEYITKGEISKEDYTNQLYLKYILYSVCNTIHCYSAICDYATKNVLSCTLIASSVLRTTIENF